MKTSILRRACLLGLGAVMPALMLSGNAQAQADYPSKPVTVVVGYAAGGATDILARLVSKSLSEELGQSFIVENRAGANSNIGADSVSRAAPDGYTLFVGSIANTINKSLYKNLTHDIQKDFAPVGLMATISNVLVVNPKLPLNSVADYVEYAKKNPGRLTCASSGVGSSIHMSCELFKLQAGVDILHVPYRGSGPAVADLLGGQVDSMFDNLPSSISHINANTLRPLATTVGKRPEALPNVPTFTEQGYKDFLVSSWFGLMAPKGTPQPVVTKLNMALNKVLQSPEIVAAYAKSGFTAPEAPNSPATFANFVDGEVKKWGEVITKANITTN